MGVNIVKGIEFKSEIKMNHLEEEEEDLDKTEDDIDSIVEIDNMDYGEEVKYQLETTHETIEEEEVDHILENTSETVEEEKLDETNQNNFEEEYKSLNPVSNVVQTETDIVNTVKGIEFKTEIKINQLEEEEEDLDRTEDDIDSLVEIDNIDYGEEVKDQVESTQQVMEMEELEETNQNNFDEEDKQLIPASLSAKKDESNSVQTETEVVNFVKGIEFKTEIIMNHLEEEEGYLEKTENDLHSIVEIDNIDYGEESRDQKETTQETVAEEKFEEITQNNFDEEDKHLIPTVFTLKEDKINVVQTTESEIVNVV